MKNIFFLFFAIVSLSISGQPLNERIIYLDSSFAETNKPNHVYYRVIADQQKNKPPYKTVDYYKSGKIYAEGSSSEKKILVPIGKFTQFYENGSKWHIQSYNNGIETGDFFSWYENGNPQIEGEFVASNDNNDKHSDFRIIQFWNSENIQTVENGNGHYKLDDQNGTEEGELKNGFRDGIWQGVNSVVHFTYQEKYIDSKLVSGVSTDQYGKKYIYHNLESKPEFQGGMNEFYSYIGKNYRTPEIRTSGGKMFFSFYIETDGRLDNIKLIRGIDSEFNNEGYRVLAACPNWISAKKRGIPIRVLYSLPMNIHEQQ